MRRYTKSHEWIELDGTVATIGITKAAREEIGEIVFVELPKVGLSLSASDLAVVLESTKAAVDIAAPLSGKVVKVNGDLLALNQSPEKEGWLFQLELQNREEFDAL